MKFFYPTQLWRFLAIFLLILSVPIQNYLTAQEAPPIYAKIVVQLADELSMEQLISSGVDLDHFHPELGENELVLMQSELPLLQASGLSYTIVSNDWAADIEARNAKDMATYQVNPLEKTTQGFELGSMGGFYTLAEIVQQLDEMTSLYPNLITSKFSIGTTFEGRDIWAVKISDNPGIDESSTEAQVYFDALHHAREPASGSTVINFMFHMLENYGTDPQITYLINNREIHIVPCVNPDGYEYNRLTNPSGGGLWRKNRRDNPGTTCEGVDLNRNYDTDWFGTTNNPCSNSYRGASVFSEPESQAIRDFVASIQPPIAYTTHTSGGYWLGPDFSDGQPLFAIHAEINNDCLDENEYIYGDADLILGYAAGTTQNWMLETFGTLSWTPEIGTTGFWPSISEIIPLVNHQIKAYEYAVWVAGAVMDFQGFSVLNSDGLTTNQNLELSIGVKNKGFSRTATNVQVSVLPDNAGIGSVLGTQSYGNIASRAEATNGTPFEFALTPGISAGTEVKFYVEVSQDGVVADRDSFYLTVGERSVLFSDGAESGTSNWFNIGSGSIWQSSSEDAYQGSNCFVDSELGHTATNTGRGFSMNNSVSLVGASNPRLEFAAKWGLHTTTDYVRLQISTDGGSSWSNIGSSAMGTINGDPAFVENERWTYQSVDLSAYIGQSVRFRFASFSNGSLPSDGFYFDEFRIVDYSSIVLPVNLIEFRGERTEEKEHRLVWQTAGEQDNDFFEIQRSADGLNWQIRGQVAGQGNTTSRQAYAFLDRAPLAGTNFYRLRQVDFSGAFAFSEVITLNNSGNWQPHPNPFNNSLIVPIEEGERNLQLFNLQGQDVLHQVTRAVQNGQIVLDTTPLPKGVYFIRYRGQSARLVKN